MHISRELGDYVATPTCTQVFVLVSDRIKFEQIRRPVTNHGAQTNGTQLFSKRIEQDGLTVLFYHRRTSNPTARRE